MTVQNPEILTSPVRHPVHPAHRDLSATRLHHPSHNATPGSQTVLQEHSIRAATRDLMMVACGDVSSSMDTPIGSASRLEVWKQSYCTAVIQTARRDPESLFGVISFNENAHIVAPPCVVGTNSEMLCGAIQSLTAGGGTRLDLGLQAARSLFDAHPERRTKSVLILTDGHSWGDVEEEAELLKQQGIDIYVIGVGERPDDVNEPLLRSIASVVDGKSTYAFVTNQMDVKSTVLMHSQMASRR